MSVPVTHRVPPADVGDRVAPVAACGRRPRPVGLRRARCADATEGPRRGRGNTSRCRRCRVSDGIIAGQQGRLDAAGDRRAARSELSAPAASPSALQTPGMCSSSVGVSPTMSKTSEGPASASPLLLQSEVGQFRVRARESSAAMPSTSGRVSGRAQHPAAAPPRCRSRARSDGVTRHATADQRAEHLAEHVRLGSGRVGRSVHRYVEVDTPGDVAGSVFPASAWPRSSVPCRTPSALARVWCRKRGSSKAARAARTAGSRGLSGMQGRGEPAPWDRDARPVQIRECRRGHPRTGPRSGRCPGTGRRGGRAGRRAGPARSVVVSTTHPGSGSSATRIERPVASSSSSNFRTRSVSARYADWAAASSTTGAPGQRQCGDSCPRSRRSAAGSASTWPDRAVYSRRCGSVQSGR